MFISIDFGQFTLEMCLAAQNHQKIHKNFYFGIQGIPRSIEFDGN